MPDTLHFEFVSPERLLVSEEVWQVVVPGREGDFAFMPGHAPVLSSMRPGMVSVTKEAGGDAARYFVRGGFAEGADGTLTILAETAIPEADLDREALAAAIRDAEEDLADASDDEARQRRQEALDHLRQIEQAI